MPIPRSTRTCVNVRACVLIVGIYIFFFACAYKWAHRLTGGTYSGGTRKHDMLLLGPFVLHKLGMFLINDRNTCLGLSRQSDRIFQLPENVLRSNDVISG